MIPNHKGEIPVVPLLVPFLLGIWSGLQWFTNVNIDLLFFISLSLIFLFIFLNLTYSLLKFYRFRWIGGALFSLILFLAGLLIIKQRNELRYQDHFSKTSAQSLAVKITTGPMLKNGLLRFTANVDAVLDNGKWPATRGTLMISIKDSAAKNLAYGNELIIPAKYTPIDPPFNPAEFNYKKYLADKNIYYQAFLYPGQYHLIATGRGNPLVASAIKLRQRLVDKLKRNMRDTSAAAVASTLILGYKADLSSDILQAYSKTGTVYVLSVSGMQVGIIYALLTIVLSFLTRYRYGRFIRAVIIIGVIWYYAMLTGFSLAVCRVSVVTSVVVAGQLFNRYINKLNILAFSAFALLLYNPFYITDVGFQLSYIAVSGLILFQPIVYSWLKFKNKWVDKLWALCSVSIAAQVVIFPISAIYFHEFPVYFLISNIFITIPAMLIMSFGIIFLLLPQIPVVSASLAYILDKTIVVTNRVLGFIENIRFATIGRLWFTTFEYLLLYGIIISLFYFFYNKKIWLLRFALCSVLLLSFSLAIKKINFAKSNEIVWLNLKKHKGIIFRNGDKAVVLTDVKGTDKTFLYSIKPYLDSSDISNPSVFNIDTDIKNPLIQKKYGLIAYLDKRIFIIDKYLPDKRVSPKIKADYIYVTGNPKLPLRNIDSCFIYKTLIMDGSNSDKTIAGIRNDADSEHIDYKILKRNISLVSVSN